MNIDPNGLIPVTALLEAELAIPIDQAVDEICKQFGYPLLGGPSGKGWSFFSLAMQCPHLWHETYRTTDTRERTKPPVELQVGSLHHSLLGLYYAFGLDGSGNAFYHNRGLLAPALVDRLGKRGRKSKNDWVQIPNDAADRLLAALKSKADINFVDRLQGGDAGEETSIVPEPKPSMSIILEAERTFDAHTNFYGDGQEDVEPLAIEWFAEDRDLGYTCRYDAIVRLGENDPFVRSGQLEAGSTCVHERKTGKWLSEMATEGWFLDGEILGQALLWKPSGCEDLFGPLAGIVVDVVTKEKIPKFARILVPPNPITTEIHRRNIRWQHAEIAQWKAAGYYPRRFVSCWRFGRRCGLYEACRSSAAEEALELATGGGGENE